MAAIFRESGLPQKLAHLASETAARSRLWPRERVDVAKELVAHFQDGIREGKSEQALFTAFGDPRIAAVLIRRSKKRNRPVWWRGLTRALRAIGIIWIALLIPYIYYGLRVWSAAPKITRDFLAELNAPALANPTDKRAWPILQRAALRLAAIPPPEITGQKDGWFWLWSQDPDSPDWPAMRRYLDQNAETIDLVREAAAKPVMGYVFRIVPDLFVEREPLRFLESQPLAQSHGNDVPVSDSLSTATTASDVGDVGEICTRVLLLRALAMIGKGRWSEAVGDFAAAFDLIDRLTEVESTVPQLKALTSLRTVTAVLSKALGATLARWPDRDLESLGKRLAEFNRSRLVRRVKANRLEVLDIVQRTFTDDGMGGGYFAHAQWASEDPALKSETRSLSESLLAPYVAVKQPSRRKIVELIERQYDALKAIWARPLWEQAPSDDLQRIERSVLYGILPEFAPILLTHFGRVSDWDGQVPFDRVQMQIDAIAVAVAVERFQRVRGEPPQALQQLVPDFLSAVPLDRFDGTDMKHSIVDGRPLLYSVGADLDDDGGRAPTPRADDPSTDGMTLGVSAWIGRLEVERIKRETPTRLPDGDWILWPPSAGGE